MSIVVGAAAMVAVHGLMRGLYRLGTEGTVRIEQAVGKTGTVYLRIPGRKCGTGKVTVNVRNRTMEYEAVTSGEALPTGCKVVVGVAARSALDQPARTGRIRLAR